MKAALMRMGILGALTWSSVAQGNDRGFPEAEPTEDTDFCGPAFFQYTVRSERGRVGEGVRCVRFDGKRMVWYGEGRWMDGSAYRHIGAAQFQYARHAHGAAAAIDGAQAHTARAYDDALEFEVTYGDGEVPVTITENATWHETWRLNATSQYVSAATGSACAGAELFTVYEVVSPGQEAALRCAPKVDLPVWYGEGRWLGKRYRQLGVLESTQNWSTPGHLYGAAYGVCGGQMLCDVLKPLELMRVADGSIIITGEVNERWRPAAAVN